MNPSPTFTAIRIWRDICPNSYIVCHCQKRPQAGCRRLPVAGENPDSSRRWFGRSARMGGRYNSRQGSRQSMRPVDTMKAGGGIPPEAGRQGNCIAGVCSRPQATWLRGFRVTDMDEARHPVQNVADPVRETSINLSSRGSNRWSWASRSAFSCIQ